MKNIVIETVNRGWIVRQFDPMAFTTASGEQHVFTTMETLKAALPELLKSESKEIPETGATSET